MDKQELILFSLCHFYRLFPLFPNWDTRAPRVMWSDTEGGEKKKKKSDLKKYGHRLWAESNLSLRLAQIQPNTAELCVSSQAHPAH